MTQVLILNIMMEDLFEI